ncbi:MAG: hypothetical protein J5I93_18480 [Pirellulaceae bacterium]|nr:hypothetical protein [Pirellulaceae bacterium]
MTRSTSIRRQQQLREAEGYLDLVLALSDRWPPRPAVRDRVAQRALDILEQLEPQRWRRADVAFLKGLALKCLERHSEAAEVLLRAAGLDPENCQILLALAWCQKRCGRLDLAIRALERALEIDASLSILHYNLACYWSLAERPARAVEYLSHALELEPKYRQLIADERDFDPIRNHPDFQALLSVIV